MCRLFLILRKTLRRRGNLSKFETLLLISIKNKAQIVVWISTTRKRSNWIFQYEITYLFIRNNNVLRKKLLSYFGHYGEYKLCNRFIPILIPLFKTVDIIRTNYYVELIFTWIPMTSNLNTNNKTHS